MLRFPYVQNVRRTRVTIRWSTLEYGSAMIAFGKDSDHLRTVAARTREFRPEETGQAASYYRHEAVLTGLTQGTDYHYRVLLDDQDLLPQENLTFRTAGANTFQFLVIGDSGTGSGDQSRLARTLTKEKPKLLLHTGDLAYPNSTYPLLERYYFDYYGSMMNQVPFFPCLGNHDYYDTDAVPCLTVHDLPSDDVREGDHGRYFSFEWANAHFIALDTNTPLLNAVEGRGDMLAWLRRDLERTKKFWRIVFFHHPPYAFGPNQDDPLSRLAREHIVPILEEYRVPVVFNGHEHSYQRSKPIYGGAAAEERDGIVYVTTGGGGAPLYPVYDSPLLDAGLSAYHYLRNEVEGHSMHLRVIGPDGHLIDSAVVAPPPILSDNPVVNAASFTPEVASGGLIAIFGLQLGADDLSAWRSPLPTELGGVRVTWNGRPLPLLMASGTQVNAQLPFDAAGPGMLRVSTPNGAAQEDLHVREVAPALFSPAVFHENGEPVTEDAPAGPEEMIHVYLTGLGRVKGNAMAGKAARSSESFPVEAPVEVVAGDASIRAAFAGLATGLAGVYRVSFATPASLASGKYELRIAAAGVRSNSAALHIRRL